MKVSMLTSAIVACALSVPNASAQEKSAPAKPAMSIDMDKHMSKMQGNMKAMQAQMDRIHKTTDPKERQKLMQAHMTAMQENMKAMRDMGGPMMKGGGEHGGMMMDGKKGGDMMKRHELMMNRMDMMQMMMEQMMQHDHAAMAK